MILITVMLFLLILSFLALSLLNTSLIEIKMSGYFQNKIFAFYKAENLLEKYEQEIIDGKIANAETSEIISTGICGVIFYRIIARAGYNGVLSVLQSVFVKANNLNQCKPAPNIKLGRQSFLVVQ